jgi:hypothetical protein
MAETNVTDKGKRAINELSTDTRVLIHFIEENLIKGDKKHLSYYDMSQAMGRDVQGIGRPNLQTARKHIEKEHGILLETVMKEGIAKSKDYVGSLDRTREHIRKASKRSLKRVLTSSTLDKELPNETRIEVNARASLLGAVVMFSADKSVKRMMGAVENNKAMELPTAETLKEFMK